MADLNGVELQSRGDKEFSTRQHTSAGSLGIEDSPRAQRQPVAILVSDFLQNLQGPRHGHGNLHRPDAAAIDGLSGLQGGLGRRGPNDWYNANLPNRS
jgi:hypothetical protein